MSRKEATSNKRRQNENIVRSLHISWKAREHLDQKNHQELWPKTRKEPPHPPHEAVIVSTIDEYEACSPYS